MYKKIYTQLKKRYKVGGKRQQNNAYQGSQWVEWRVEGGAIKIPEHYVRVYTIYRCSSVFGIQGCVYPIVMGAMAHGGKFGI